MHELDHPPSEGGEDDTLEEIVLADFVSTTSLDPYHDINRQHTGKHEESDDLSDGISPGEHFDSKHSQREPLLDFTMQPSPSLAPTNTSLAPSPLILTPASQVRSPVREVEFVMDEEADDVIHRSGKVKEKKKVRWADSVGEDLAVVFYVDAKGTYDRTPSFGRSYGGGEERLTVQHFMCVFLVILAAVLLVAILYMLK